MLGFVNRFSHGVLRVNRELSTNGNGSPEYNFGLRTALLVIVHIAIRHSNSGSCFTSICVAARCIGASMQTD